MLNASWASSDCEPCTGACARRADLHESADACQVDEVDASSVPVQRVEFTQSRRCGVEQQLPRSRSIRPTSSN